MGSIFFFTKSSMAGIVADVFIVETCIHILDLDLQISCAIIN